MINFAQVGEKPNLMFGTLPNYFKENDSYKPSTVEGFEDDGFLERYLEAFCEDIDDDLIPYVESLGYLYDATGLSNIPNLNLDAFIDYISSMLGNPPDIGTDAQYRTLLRYLRWILQVKGTYLSLKLYLALFGYKVKSFISTPLLTPTYDNTPVPYKYDDGYQYDMQQIWFFNVDIVITDYDGIHHGDPGVLWLNYLREALGSFIMPIFVNIRTLTYEP